MAQLAQAQKLEALGQLAGGVAHDFNNVLQAITGGARMILRRGSDAPAVRRFAGMVLEAADRGISVTRRLLAFARRDALRADAREHRVVVRPIEVNASEWDCSLEPDRASADGLALRLGLGLVAGLAAEDGKAVAKARRAGNGAPFASVEEVARRAGVGRPALQALAAADAFTGLGSPRRTALWAAAAMERRTADTLPLFRAAESDPPLILEPDPRLPVEREGEAVVEDYGATGLTLRVHPLALLRPELDRFHLADTRQLATLRQGGWIRLPGLVLMRQRPGTAKGIVFVTLEDEHGQANIVVYAQIGERDRAALLGARLLVVEGRVERQTEGAEVPILHVIARRLLDRSDLLDGLRRSHAGEAAWAERGLGRADAVPRLDPGSAAPRPVLGKSRDFR
ncbi:hypothetical protein KSF81_05500 [Siccirubricoccus sp. G192]|nr:hypothetical protein [Siccirubricoccus sp. G192]